LTIILICIQIGPLLVAVGFIAMYVCLCHAISDRQIREIVDRGAASLGEVQAHLPVASCCGTCEDTARTVIESHCKSAPPSKLIAA
jgi:bacterioferritin-associated ferredoxin